MKYSEKIMTPTEFVRCHNFWCRCLVDGVPIPANEAFQYQSNGKKVDWWQPCAANDEHAKIKYNLLSFIQ